MNVHGYVSSLLTLLMVLGSPPAGQQSNQSVPTATSPEQVRRVHSKLHHQGLAGQVPEMLSQTSGDVELRTGRAPVMTIEMDAPNELANLACGSDLVVVGRTGAGVSHITADQGYVYTDWSFTVENVLKDNSKAPVRVGSQIVVTRPGGSLAVNGRKVSANPHEFRNFNQGEQLLLYLRFIPQTGAYLLTGPFGFAFVNGKTTGFGKAPLRSEFEANDQAKMVDQVKASVVMSGSNPHCGGNNQ